MIKAIETEYNGYRFRSRLEARWAVFFDTLGIQYRYEPEGFDIKGTWYLPDFHLSEKDCWVEVKGSLEAVSEISETATKIMSLVKHTKSHALILVGDVWPNEFKAYSFKYTRCPCPDCKKGWHIYIQICTTFPGETNNLVDAFKAARQARFEHGEKP